MEMSERDITRGETEKEDVERGREIKGKQRARETLKMDKER